MHSKCNERSHEKTSLTLDPQDVSRNLSGGVVESPLGRGGGRTVRVLPRKLRVSQMCQDRLPKDRPPIQRFWGCKYYEDRK